MIQLINGHAYDKTENGLTCMWTNVWYEVTTENGNVFGLHAYELKGRMNIVNVKCVPVPVVLATN